MSINEELVRYTPPTLRVQIARAAERAQEEVLRVAKLEHTLPAKWLDMTPEQIWEKYGFSVHV